MLVMLAIFHNRPVPITIGCRSPVRSLEHLMGNYKMQEVGPDGTLALVMFLCSNTGAGGNSNSRLTNPVSKLYVGHETPAEHHSLYVAIVSTSAHV